MVLFVTTLAFVQTLVVLYLLPLRGGQSRDYPYIRVLVVSLILHLGIELYLLGVLHDEFLFNRLNSFTSFSYGPLLWFQYRQAIGRPLSWSTRLRHLIPFLVAFGLYLYSVITWLPLQQRALFQTVFTIYRYSVMASWVLYFGYLLWAIHREMRRADPRLAVADRGLLVQVSSLFLSALLGSQLLKAGAASLGIPYESHTFPYLVFGLISFLCLRFFFTLPLSETQPMRIPESGSESRRPELTVPEKEVVAYEKSGLTEEQMEMGWRQMETLMQCNRPFVDPELALDDLSGRLKLSRQHVSQILNQRAGKNFYAYINEYRVREMQQLMRQKPNGRILELAFEVGFQSKTTLNAYFKKATGLSPSQYQQQLTGERTERVHS